MTKKNKAKPPLQFLFPLFATLLLFPERSKASEIVQEDFPYASKYVEVNGAKMHYADSEGAGDPILLVHGIPTWSYLWRKVIPEIEDRGRVIAVDLIGFGKSDKPKIGYKLSDQVSFFEAFVQALRLKNITLVVHDMGSFIGLHYAMTHEANVKGIAFMESMIRLDTWENMPKENAAFMKSMRDPQFAYNLVVNERFSIEMMIPYNTKRQLSPTEMDTYRMPFQSKSDRETLVPLWMDFPISSSPKTAHRLQHHYVERLQQSALPKLMLTISEPAVGTPSQVAWAKANLSNIRIVNVGEGRHFMQEDQPKAIGTAIKRWMDEHAL